MTDRAELVDTLLDFVESPNPNAFDRLALEVLRHQAAAVAPYGRLVAATGGLPKRWQDAPLVPTELFKELDISSAAPDTAVEATFLTSGTTVGVRGRRRVPDLELYHAGMFGPFIDYVLDGDPSPKPWLALIPRTSESSLSHMVAELGEELATRVTWAFDDLDLAWERLTGTNEPMVVLATAFALVHVLDNGPGQAAHLPSGSRLMLTGGFKGKTREVSEELLLATVEGRLGLPAHAVVPEYGMTELTSQAYGQPFVAPPWLKIRVVDPVSLVDVEPGAQGLIAFFDLLNLDNVSAILTGDLGSLDAEGGLTLFGRAPGAALRGCSLSAEELLGR